MTTDMLTAAIDYAAHGFAVFPCAAGAKIPLKGSAGCKDASTDPTTIRSWWTATPSANVAIATAGLLVVDVDGGENPWPTDPGQRDDLMAAPTSITPRGGRHHIYRQPRDRTYRNTASRLAPNVDTRAAGGYIVAAPSVVDGRAYRWVVPLPALTDLPLPPAWLVAALDALTTQAPPRTGNGHHTHGIPRYVQAALDAELGRVAMARPGTRNDTLNRAAYALGRFIGAGGVNRDDLAGMLADAAQRCGLPATEAAATIKSGITAGMGQPWTPGANGRTAPAVTAPGDSPRARFGVTIIRDYLQRRYEPTFRRGPLMYSAALGREVARSEVVDAPGSDLIDELMGAVDFPRSESGPKRGAIPSFYRAWAPVAWRDIMDALPDEHDTAEIAESAAEQFRAAVGDALMTMESFAVRPVGDDRGEYQRRSLISWCATWAKPGPWQSVRTLALWTRREDDGRLAIAMHARLFSQIRRPGLSACSHRRFVQLAEQYGVGIGDRAGRSRAVVLAPEFIAELQAGPGDAPVDGDVDGDVDAHPYTGFYKSLPSTVPSTSPSTEAL